MARILQNRTCADKTPPPLLDRIPVDPGPPAAYDSESRAGPVRPGALRRGRGPGAGDLRRKETPVIRRLIPVTLLLAVLATAAAAQSELERIWALAQEGKLDEAATAAEALTREKPDDPAGWHALGRIRFFQERYPEAASDLGRCIALEPKEAWMTAWSHDVLGQAYVKLGERELAEEHLRKAIEMNATANCTKDATRALAELTGEDPWGKGPLVGHPLPEFRFFGLADETYGPEDFRGSPTLFKLGPSW